MSLSSLVGAVKNLWQGSSTESPSSDPPLPSVVYTPFDRTLSLHTRITGVKPQEIDGDTLSALTQTMSDQLTASGMSLASAEISLVSVGGDSILLSAAVYQVPSSSNSWTFTPTLDARPPVKRNSSGGPAALAPPAAGAATSATAASGPSQAKAGPAWDEIISYTAAWAPYRFLLRVPKGIWTTAEHLSSVYEAARSAQEASYGAGGGGGKPVCIEPGRTGLTSCTGGVLVRSSPTDRPPSPPPASPPTGTDGGAAAGAAASDAVTDTAAAAASSSASVNPHGKGFLDVVFDIPSVFSRANIYDDVLIPVALIDGERRELPAHTWLDRGGHVSLRVLVPTPLKPQLIRFVMDKRSLGPKQGITIEPMTTLGEVLALPPPLVAEVSDSPELVGDIAALIDMIGPQYKDKMFYSLGVRADKFSTVADEIARFARDSGRTALDQWARTWLGPSIMKRSEGGGVIEDWDPAAS